MSRLDCRTGPPNEERRPSGVGVQTNIGGGVNRHIKATPSATTAQQSGGKAKGGNSPPEVDHGTRQAGRDLPPEVRR